MSEHSEPGSEGSDAESMDKSWQLERSDASQEDLDGSMSDTDPVSATQLDTLFGPQYILDANYATVTGANVPSPCDVRIMIEVYADDLSKCVIYQRGSHPPASDEHYLQYSRRIRLYLMERGSQSGMTPSKLRLEMQQGLSGLGDAGALPRMFVRPEWRLPTTQQVDRVIAGLRRAVRLHSDPFVAVDLFVGLNPNLIFAYEPLVVTSTRKQFSVGIKS
ncbi:unnamed protein product, partial [Tilletia caries]